MGNFNGTCMVTNLPIREGEEVVAFLMAREATWKGPVGYPMSLPLFGTYDGYGKIEYDTASQVKNFTLAHVCRFARFGKDCKVKSVSDLTLEALLRVAVDAHVDNDRGITMTRTLAPGQSALNLVMVHQWVYEDLAEPVHDPRRKHVEEHFDKVARWKAAFHAASGNYEELAQLSLRRGFHDEFKAGPLWRYLVEPEVTFPLGPATDLLLFHQALWEARKGWAIPVRSGQDTYYDIHATLAHGVLAHCKQEEYREEE